MNDEKKRRKKKRKLNTIEEYNKKKKIRLEDSQTCYLKLQGGTIIISNHLLAINNATGNDVTKSSFESGLIKGNKLNILF